MTTSKLRNLNDYESMLATSTCNVGIRLFMPSHEAVASLLSEAWSRCVSERLLLQVRLVPRKDETISPLGKRYMVKPICDEDGLLVIYKIPSSDDLPDLVRELQRIGTNALDILKGSYHVVCIVKEMEESRVSIQVVISLCHALSDGPGALQVARSFLRHLGEVLDISQPTNNNETVVNLQPITDLQALILGSKYAINEEPKPVFAGQDEFAAALTSRPMTLNGTMLLPPETMQNLPSDSGFGGPSCIECIHFSLTEEETSALRLACRDYGTTVQGVLTAAALHTRVTLLDLELPIHAAVQTPVNTRSLASVDQDECLCGSAGVWHMAQLCQDKDVLALAKRSTESVRAALQDEQPREWLRRLLNDVATLPPYSLMASSIGVAPIECSYGKVDVEKVLFFGGSLRTDQLSRAQATMIHAITFRGELHCMFNFTWPGVAKSFANDTAREMKTTLLSMAACRTE